MDYVTKAFDNTPEGLKQKDAETRQMAARGYQITNEHIEQGHIKGNEQCCWALICLPGIFLAGRTPGQIIVTYGQVVQFKCPSCDSPTRADAKFCTACGSNLSIVRAQPRGTKKCPACAEQIKEDAKKCRFCGELLSP